MLFLVCFPGSGGGGGGGVCRITTSVIVGDGL